eukprot:scaffold20896_cov33-Tisochrysis_lutea.AAC.3
MHRGLLGSQGTASAASPDSCRGDLCGACERLGTRGDRCHRSLLGLGGSVAGSALRRLRAAAACGC